MKSGFTLIELLIYFGIIAGILVLSSGFTWEILQGNIKTNAQREVEENANFAMAKITFAIRNASEVNRPDEPGEKTNLLFLKMKRPAKNPTRFELSQGKITIKEGNFGPFPLTSDLVEVRNLQFTNLSFEDTPGTLKIEMTIEHKNPENRNEYRATKDLETTASLRY